MVYLSPHIIRSPDDAETLLRRFTPLSIAMLVWIATMGSSAQWYHFAAFCVAAWPLSVTHPLVVQRFDPAEAGRAIAFLTCCSLSVCFFGNGGLAFWFRNLGGGMAQKRHTSSPWLHSPCFLSSATGFLLGCFATRQRPCRLQLRMKKRIALRSEETAAEL